MREETIPVVCPCREVILHWTRISEDSIELGYNPLVGGPSWDDLVESQIFLPKHTQEERICAQVGELLVESTCRCVKTTEAIRSCRLRLLGLPRSSHSAASAAPFFLCTAP